jgi:hypothetical protein
LIGTSQKKIETSAKYKFLLEDGVVFPRPTYIGEKLSPSRNLKEKNWAFLSLC